MIATLFLGLPGAFFGGMAGYGIASAIIPVIWREEVNQAKQEIAGKHGVKWSDPLLEPWQIMGDLSCHELPMDVSTDRDTLSADDLEDGQRLGQLVQEHERETGVPIQQRELFR